jgi:hypothetical protein
MRNSGVPCLVWSHGYKPLPRQLPSKMPSSTPPYDPARLLRGGLNRHTTKLISEYSKKLAGRVYYDVGGFYERYFEGRPWTNNARDIYEESKAQYTEGHWSGWPEPSLQGPFFEWFMEFQDIVLSGQQLLGLGTPPICRNLPQPPSQPG